jgi:Polyketide cyclase / dehydrase and lipid transport
MTAPLAGPSASATVQIDCSPDEIYRLITDLPTLAALAEEAVAMEWSKRVRENGAVCKGAVFVGYNENSGKRWATKCTVTDAEPGRVFAFDVRYTVLPIARWQYDLVAADGGCRVTESTWDRRPGWFRKVGGKATGVSDRTSANAEHIQLTLQRLKQRAESGQLDGHT